MKYTRLLSKLRVGAALAALLCLVLAADHASAQEEAEYGYVDLVLQQEFGTGRDTNKFAYSVQNVGTMTATGVTVSFELLNVLARHSTANPSLLTATITGLRTDNDTKQQWFTWEIGTIGPGAASTQLLFSTVRHTGFTNIFDIGQLGVITATASAISPEPDILLANNNSKAYTYVEDATDQTRHMIRARLELRLSVDDLRPAGVDVGFDLTAFNDSGTADARQISRVANASVRVELSDGLEFKDSWTPPATFVKSGSQSATWFPADTDVESNNDPDPPRFDETRIEAQLTSDSLTDIPLEERCITAWVENSIPPPEPGYVFDSLTQCLGDDPWVLFDEGQVDLFTLEATAQNDLELAIQVSKREQPKLHSEGILRRDGPPYGEPGEPFVILTPENVVIQVKDSPLTRGSLTDGGVTSMTWQTKGGDVQRGVEVRENINSIVPLNQQRTESTVWTNGKDKLTTSGIDGGSAPGTMRIFIGTWKLADADDSSFTDTGGFTTDARAYPFGGNLGIVTGPVVLHFGELGTYKARKTYKGTHSTTGEQTTDEETYTFHVGPIAELEARDGGPSPAAPAGQRAYTIMAVNNGPDDAPGAQITLTGLDGGDYVSHNATAGSFDPSTGVWSVGELRSKEYHQGVYGRDGEVLTIITAAAGDAEITAEIENTQDYRVCIDSDANDVAASSQSACTSGGNSWHTTEYYDYDSDNDSATILARTGTGTDLPSLQGTVAISAAVLIRWNPILKVNGRPVTHYEVQKQTTSWTTMGRTMEPRYVDTDLAAGETGLYRVRGINDRGQEGPWSAHIGGMTSEGGRPTAPTGVTATPDGASAIDVTWQAPAGDGGSAITRYEVQWSADGQGSWRRAGYTANGQTLTFKHGSLSQATTRYYRVRARNSAGDGPWSEPPHPSATTLANVPGVPRNFRAVADGANTIELTWVAPSDDGGSAIVRYEIDWTGDNDADAQTEALAYTDGGLDPGTERDYRVRAVNGTGEGSWSAVRSASTDPVIPNAPERLRAVADGENAIILTWEPPGYDGGGRITHYEIQVATVLTATTDDFRTLSVRNASAGLTFTHASGLNPGDTRHYRVRAKNSAGWSDWSATNSATTQTGVPDAPGSFRAQANGSSEIILTWTKPDDQGEEVQMYEIEWSANGSGPWAELATIRGADTTTYLDTGLAAATTRHYRIRARNFNGPGQWSVTRSATTAASAPTEAPSWVTQDGSVAAAETAIDLEWSVTAGSGQGITGYWLERSRDGQAPWERLRSGGGTGTTYTDTKDLFRGITRYYRVAAVNRNGAGPWSDVIGVTTAGEPSGPPGWVGLLRFTAVGRSSVTLAWNPPPVEEGGAPVTGYQYQVMRPGGPDEPRETRGTSVTISGLNIEGDYEFSVRALNAVGAGPAESITAYMAPSSSGSVVVSRTSLTVTEGSSAGYTVRLSHAPTGPVLLNLGAPGFTGLQYDSLPQSVILTPGGWTAPDGCDALSRYTARTWSQGVTVTLRIEDDDVPSVDENGRSVNEVGLFTHDVFPLSQADLCGGTEDSVYEPYRVGPSVLVTRRDND